MVSHGDVALPHLLPLKKQLNPLHAAQLLLAFRFEAATSSHLLPTLVACVAQQSVRSSADMDHQSK